MGSRRTKAALRRRAAIALAVWTVAFALLAVAAALPQGPVAVLAVDDAYPLVGQVVHFNASASAGHDAGNGRIAAYNFSFGDGFDTGWQASALAEHAYAADGSFVATVTVVDHRGQEGSASVAVHPGLSPPPPVRAPDLVPIQARLVPAAPTVNASINLTVVVLNRGGANATAARLVVVDAPPNGSAAPVGSLALPGPVAASQTVSLVVGPFLLGAAGNHTLRILVTNVTPAETSTADHELDLRVTVLPAEGPPGPGGGPGGGGNGGAGLEVSPVAVGLAAAGVAAGVGAGYLFLRPPPKGPLEPPPAGPPDRSPPPLWPP